MKADLVIRHVNVATMASSQGYAEVLNGAVVVRGGLIEWVGPDSELPSSLEVLGEFDVEGRWLTPGLIDCHTHLVWGGSRSDEFEQRLEGKTYEEIARGGGGIMSTVRATRAASEGELFQSASQRLQALMSEGVTTCEIKSGYGLTIDSEIKCLKVASRLGSQHLCRIVPTLLAAHCVPPEYAGQADRYISWVCGELLHDVSTLGLATSVDAFCERIAFTPEQTRRFLEEAREWRFTLKLHADQLSDSGGAGLIAELGGLSADHCEYTSEVSVRKMAKHGTVAVLLPGALYNLRETKKPPVDLFRQSSVPMAVATDCNPGTSPFTSLLLMMNMACVLFCLTPAEALAGVTRNAARALGLDGVVGRIEPGMQADLAIFEVDHPRDLAASFGGTPCVASWFGGIRRSTGKRI